MNSKGSEQPRQMSKVAYAYDWADEARRTCVDGEYSTARQALFEKETAATPIYIGIVEAVVYHEKVDRYVLKFGKSSVKTTAEVAAFVLEHDKIARA